MIKQVATVTTLVSLALSAAFVNAASGIVGSTDSGLGGKITFQSVVKASSCTIDSESQDKIVDLGEFDTTTIANNATQLKEVALKLQNCAAGTFSGGVRPSSATAGSYDALRIDFNLQDYDSNSGAFKNKASNNAATGVGVALYDMHGTKQNLSDANGIGISVLDTKSFSVVSTGQHETATMKFQAKLVALKGNQLVRAGNVEVPVDYSIYYY